MTLTDSNYHKRLLEMCDCYLDTDFKPVLQSMTGGQSSDVEEDAIKYFALTILEAMTEKAQKLVIKEKKGNKTVVVKSDEKNSLPLPSDEVFDKVFSIVRNVLDISEEKGKSALSLGLKNGQIEVEVKLEEAADKRSIKIKFPNLGS